MCYSKSSSLVNRNGLFHDTSTESTNKITHAHETEQGTPIAAQERGLVARRRTHMRGGCSRCRTRPRSSSRGRGGCSRVGPCAERRRGGGCPGCRHHPQRMPTHTVAGLGVLDNPLCVRSLTLHQTRMRCIGRGLGDGVGVVMELRPPWHPHIHGVIPSMASSPPWRACCRFHGPCSGGSTWIRRSIWIWRCLASRSI